MIPLHPWLPSAAWFAASVVLALLLWTVIVPALRRWAQRVRSEVDDLLIESLARPLGVWILLGGLAAAAQEAPIEGHHVLVVHKAVTAFFLLTLTFALARLASLAVSRYSRGLRGSARTTGVIDNLVRTVVIAVGGLLILSNIGISIAPLLGALGVGSLAVALALQDTLGNFFSGIHLVASEVVAVGDYIRTDSGQEGTVLDVGWRVTRLDDGGGNQIIVPNSKLAGAVVTNFHKPTQDGSVTIAMSAPSGWDLERLERVMLEVARQVQAGVEGATRDFAPIVRFKAFGDAKIEFTTVLHSDSYPQRHLLIHEFIKAASARLRSEGLESPIPERIVHLRQDGA